MKKIIARIFWLWKNRPHFSIENHYDKNINFFSPKNRLVLNIWGGGYSIEDAEKELGLHEH